MRRYWTSTLAAVTLGGVSLWAVATAGDAPAAQPPTLASRVRYLIAQQDDGVRAILTAGEKDLRRMVEAAHALHRIGQVRDAELGRVRSELAASWRSDLGGYADDSLAAGLAANPTDLENRYDLLRLNVEVGEFLAQAAGTGADGLPRPDYAAMVAAVSTGDEPRFRLLRARAARLGAPSTSTSGGSPDCADVADQVRRDDFNEAAVLMMQVVSSAGCRGGLSALLGRLENAERSIVAAIRRERTYGDGDINALDELRILAHAAGRERVPKQIRHVARDLLNQMDGDAGRFGAVTRPQTLSKLGGLLDGDAPPPTPNVVGRLETLIALGGSLATGVVTDWYTTALMAHAARLAGAIPAEQAASLFGHTTMRADGSKPPDWILAFRALTNQPSSGRLTSVRVEQTEPEDASYLLAKAILASDTGRCADAPAAKDYPQKVDGAAPVDGLFQAIALTLSRHCSPDLTDRLDAIARTVEPPAGLPNVSVRGDLYGYWATAETACLVDGSFTPPDQLGWRLDNYLESVAAGTIHPTLFDPLDLYAALRLRDMSDGRCDGGWWHGMAT